MSAETRKPTAAQLRALRAIERGSVFYEAPWARFKARWLSPTGVGSASVQRVVDARWARVGSHRAAFHHEVVLTDAGRALFAAAPASTGEESRG